MQKEAEDILADPVGSESESDDELKDVDGYDDEFNKKAMGKDKLTLNMIADGRGACSRCGRSPPLGDYDAGEGAGGHPLAGVMKAAKGWKGKAKPEPTAAESMKTIQLQNEEQRLN